MVRVDGWHTAVNGALSARQELSVCSGLAGDCALFLEISRRSATYPCERVKLVIELETDLDADRRRIFASSHIATSSIRSSTRASKSSAKAESPPPAQSPRTVTTLLPPPLRWHCDRVLELSTTASAWPACPPILYPIKRTAQPAPASIALHIDALILHHLAPGVSTTTATTCDRIPKA